MIPEKSAPRPNNWMLFFSFFRIASVVVGGGFAIIAAIEEEFVRRKKLLSADDIVEMITITQTVPGIIACNSAIYVGSKINGKSGAFAAVAGAILPSVIIISLIAGGFAALQHALEHPIARGAFRGVLSGIVALVAVAAFKMSRKVLKSTFARIVAIIGFIGVAILKIPLPWLAVAAIAAGIIAVICRKYLRRNTTTAGEE